MRESGATVIVIVVVFVQPSDLAVVGVAEAVSVAVQLPAAAPVDPLPTYGVDVATSAVTPGAAGVLCVATAFTALVGVKVPYVAVAKAFDMVLTHLGVTVTVPTAVMVLYFTPVTWTVAEFPAGRCPSLMVSSVFVTFVDDGTFVVAAALTPDPVTVALFQYA